MRRATFVTCLLMGLAVPRVGLGQAVDLGVSIRDGELSALHFAVGDYYRVPVREVIVVERRLPPDEISVAFYIARRARVAPLRVVELRLAGRSWWDIGLHYGLGPEIYYVPAYYYATPVRHGPPYGRAHGYRAKRGGGRVSALADRDIIELVNLRLISEHYGYPVDRVVELRSRGYGIPAIHEDARRVARGRGRGR